MSTQRASSSEKIRARLDHPVIDADGHTIEFMPAVRDRLKDVAGGELVNKVFSHATGFPDGWYRASPEKRLATRRVRPPWWGVPSENTLDRTTAMLPKLMYERLGETGADFAIVYPTVGLMALGTPMDEVRQALCRAINDYHHTAFAAYRDRLSPVALIPSHTPDEAIAELDYAVGELGYRNVLMSGLVSRPLQGGDSRHAFYVDHLGIDSPYDYDPVWQRCQELKVAPAFHSGGMGWGSRNSPNNYMFNHVGHFAAACEATCKSLFMAGVTKRFPARVGPRGAGVLGSARVEGAIEKWRAVVLEGAGDDPGFIDAEERRMEAAANPFQPNVLPTRYSGRVRYETLPICPVKDPR